MQPAETCCQGCPISVHCPSETIQLACRAAPKGVVGAGKNDNLYTAMHAAMRPKGAQQAKDVTIRAIEQGGKLVACPALGLRAVLQMPRGNLEGVCPRVLVLAGIAAHLQVTLCFS